MQLLSITICDSKPNLTATWRPCPGATTWGMNLRRRPHRHRSWSARTMFAWANVATSMGSPRKRDLGSLGRECGTRALVGVAFVSLKHVLVGCESLLEGILQPCDGGRNQRTCESKRNIAPLEYQNARLTFREEV